MQPTMPYTMPFTMPSTMLCAMPYALPYAMPSTMLYAMPYAMPSTMPYTQIGGLSFVYSLPLNGDIWKREPSSRLEASLLLSEEEGTCMDITTPFP